MIDTTTHQHDSGWSAGSQDDRSTRGEYGPTGISLRLRGRSVLFDTDLSPDEIDELLSTASRLKGMRKSGLTHTYLTGKTLGLVFQHPSTRTRTAFQVGMEQLGGHTIFLGTDDLQLRRGETIEDTAEIMSLYLDAVACRVASHQDLLDFAAGASIPVYNGLTEKSHPIEALGDLFTLQEKFGDLKGQTFCYLGDGNNMCNSLLLAGSAMGVNVHVAAPAEYHPQPDIVSIAHVLAARTGAKITITESLEEAVTGADAVYTDVHQSMGQNESTQKATQLAAYRVTAGVMAMAKPTAVFMHCLPMRRGEEVDADVADGPQSIIFDQAENRLHVHKALLLHTLC